MSTLMISCQKASSLVERRDQRPLDMSERFGLWMHMRICAGCKCYQKQSALIDQWLEERADPAKGEDTSALQGRIISGIDG